MTRAADGSMAALGAFGRWWLIALLAAVASAIAANMFVGVPLGTVVDVLLAVMLVGLVALEVWFAIRGAGLLISGRSSEAMLWLGAMVVYLLLVFPPILAFDTYAWATHQTLYGASHLYDSVTGAVAGVFKVPAQLISAAMVLLLNAGSSYVNYVAQARTGLEIAANALSILVALRSLGLNRRRAREAAHER